MNTTPQKPALLVTGSGDLIGQALLQNSYFDRYHCFALDHRYHSPAANEVFLHCDLTSEESIRTSLQRIRAAGWSRITSVLHLADLSNFSGEPHLQDNDLAAHGTLYLLRALADFEVEQFILASTMFVHAPCEPGSTITEGSPVLPVLDYAKSKARAEGILEAEHHGVPEVILRLACVYDDECHSHPLAQQIERIYHQRLTGHLYPGDIGHGHAFVHVQDVVEALERAIERRDLLEKRTVFLIGEPKTRTYGDLQTELARLLQSGPWDTQEIPKRLGKTSARLHDMLPGTQPFIRSSMIDHVDDHYALDISQARELLGWMPRHSLWEALPSMVARLQEEPEAWFEENGILPTEALH